MGAAMSTRRRGEVLAARPTHAQPIRWPPDDRCMEILPAFSSLTKNYPSKREHPTRGFLGTIGGQVRQSLRDDANTCALRMSWCLNKSGAPLVHTAGLYVLTGATPAIAPGDHRPAPSVARFVLR